MHKGTVRRFNEIVRVLAFYGFGHLVDSRLNKEQRSPDNLRKAFVELGPTFIKIGQILSTRPDILSASYIESLSKLQDNVPPETFEDISEVFYKEFNKKIEDSFIYFNKTPLASASIAQVYNAVLPNGQEVIVKIQRPDIEEKMKQDINILKKLLTLTKTRIPDSFINPEEALQELLTTTELELNFEIEANNIHKFKELNKNVAFVYAPFIYSEYCSSKAITMEKINGFKIDNIRKLELGGYDSEDLAKKLALSYFKQVFGDGFFHGDPHPGNLLIREGKICFIDFGIVGSFNKSIKEAMNEAIVSIALRDINKCLSAVMSISIKKGYINKNSLYDDIEYMFDSYLSTSMKNIRISVLMQELFDICKRNNLQLPKDLIVLARSMLIIEGVVTKIDPTLSILDVAIPFVKSNNSNALFKMLKFDEILIQTYSVVRDSSKIPGKLLELSDSFLNGRAKVQLQLTGLNKTVNDLSKMANRLVVALIVAAMLVSSAMILNSNIGPKLYGMSVIGLMGYAISGVMGLWLLISIIKSGKI